MAKIDLLPWREVRREKRNKDFKATLVLIAIVSAGAVGIGFQYFKSAVQVQNARNTYLQTETAALDKKIAEIQKLRELRTELIDRMELIQALQGNRPVIVRVFDEIVRAVPDDLYFTDLQVKGNKVTVKGVAASNNRLSAMMRNFDSSVWFRDPQLIKVEANKSGTNNFEIEMIRVQPSQAADGGK
ncbi:MAG: pilus assembly protein PilN [Oceanospirillaceae bacterium]|nr:pilus assembly protein PilN [Oceanospirillaceae bacterium]|tara:strand:+ start:8912 stop:9469 length:558 start_codon:yes stop_codon:yes gene_type:complete